MVVVVAVVVVCCRLNAVLRHTCMMREPEKITTDLFAAERLQMRGTDHELPVNHTISVLAAAMVKR
jgi:hypothetical protein